MSDIGTTHRQVIHQPNIVAARREAQRRLENMTGKWRPSTHPAAPIHETHPLQHKLLDVEPAAASGVYYAYYERVAESVDPREAISMREAGKKLPSAPAKR